MKYVAIGLLLMSHLAWSTRIEVLTEEYAPYNYSEQGQIQGIGTIIVEATLKRAGYEYQISILPWSRAYKQTQSNPNTLIYSISRSPQREPYFHWIGVIADIEFHFFSLASRQDIQPFNTLNTAKKYRVGSIRDDYLEQFLMLQGFKNLQRNNNHQANLEKLLLGRIDLWPVSKEAASYYLKAKALSPTTYLKKVHTITDFSGGELYMAMGLHTSPEVVHKISQALAEIKQDGTYQALINQYLSQ